MTASQKVLDLLVIVWPYILHATQFVYNDDFTATCYSRIDGYSGPQIDYDSSELSTTLFDGLAIAGDITIGGTDYFVLQINFDEPIDVNFKNEYNFSIVFFFAMITPHYS